MKKLTIEPGQEVQHFISQRFLRVIYASKSVEISGDDFAVMRLANKQTIDIEKPRQVRFKNVHDLPLILEFEASPFMVFNMDEVMLAKGVEVLLAEGSTLDLGEVTMAQDAELGIKAGANVAVNNLPALQSVQVENFPATTAVSVQDLPAISGKVKKDASGSYSGLPQRDLVADSTEVIAGNAARKFLQIKADIANTGKVWIGTTVAGVGIPISMGESAEIECTADLNIYSDVANTIYLAEVLE